MNAKPTRVKQNKTKINKKTQQTKTIDNIQYEI